MGTIAKSELTSLSLSERLKKIRNQPVLLIDISGSTNRDIEPGCSELQAMKNIVADLPASTVIYTFSNNCQKTTHAEFLACSSAGSTVMSRAFELLKKNGHSKVILITDGEAALYDQDLALEAAKNLSLQIMFVGPGKRPEFLDRLANLSSGYCTTEDLKMQKELSGKLTLLLEAGQSKESIQL